MTTALIGIELKRHCQNLGWKTWLQKGYKKQQKVAVKKKDYETIADLDCLLQNLQNDEKELIEQITELVKEME